MRRRWFKFTFFLVLTLLTCLLMLLLLAGEPLSVEDVVKMASGGQLPAGLEMLDSWTYSKIYSLAKIVDAYPLIVVIFLGIIALVEVTTALMYLTTPAEEKMIRYSQGDDEVLVNLDTLAVSLQNTVQDEPDVENVRILLRVPPGKQLHIRCFIRLDLVEQINIPSRVEQIRARIRTHFEQSLPLEAKFTSSIELKIIPSKTAQSKRDSGEKKKDEPITGDFQGPIFPVGEEDE